MPAMPVEPGNCGPSAAHDHHNPGRFPFNKNSSFKFRKFRLPNRPVHSGCTDPTQATPCLVIILVSRIQKSSTGDNNFVKWKGTFWSDWLKWPARLVKADHLQSWSRIIQLDRTKMRPFHLMNQPKFLATPATPLIQPNCFDPLVTVLRGFHCTYQREGSVRSRTFDEYKQR